MGRSKRKHKVVDVEKEDLGRFAGSSDEEEEEPIRQQKMNDAGAHADDEDNKDDAGEDSSKQLDKDSDGDDDDLISDDDGEALEPEVGPESSSAKMSNAMARILGTTTHKKSATSSVVLSKTTTPLQRMQMKEKEQAKELREKRRQNRERSLTALHIPLSVATTNTIDTGRNSVAKELEQERFHRRVATRGVVALFNAITQHQKSSEDDHVGTKSKQEPKLTKHGFLDKIKSAVSSSNGDKAESSKEKGKDDQEKEPSKWNALKDDYLLNSKKNWDEESSDDDEDAGLDDETSSPVKEPKGIGQAKKKRRRGNKQ